MPALLDYVLYTVLAWLGLKLGILLLNLGFFPVLRREKLRGPRPTVSLLVPARNEAHNLRETLPGMLLQGVQEILLLDDHSTDATAQVVEEFSRQDARVRLIPGLPKPEGWMGKTWACFQLAQAAQGEVLLFTDATCIGASAGCGRCWPGWSGSVPGWSRSTLARSPIAWPSGCFCP